MMRESLLPRIDELFDSGAFSEARRILRDAISTMPDFYLYYECLGDVALAEGKPEDARAAYQKALKLQPRAGWIQEKIVKVSSD